MYRLPTTFTVRKRINYQGVTYNPGQTIPGNVVATMRNSDALLSEKYIIPTPDPYARTTSPETPTPVSLPATVRKKLMAGGALLSVPGDDHDLVVEANVVDKKPSSKTKEDKK